jgi:DNA repair protein RecN (Recombination protein N)
MLQELSIRNFAIIDDLHIVFSDGLTVLSGETGAGKSIIINAVNLLLGSRATSTLIRTGAETAELEAFFEITRDSPVARVMEEHGYDPSEGLLVRRIISRHDRHKIYINGRLATIQLLISITENLASISGQHAHQGLLKQEQHLLILDQFGGLLPLRAEMSRLYHELVPLIHELSALKAKKQHQAEQIELLEFQRKEIAGAAVNPGEDADLEKERTRLRNAEALYQAVHESVEALYSAQGAVVERLVMVRKTLEKASQIDPELSSSVERIAGTTYRLEDVVEELRSYLNTVQIDEGRLEMIEGRLDLLRSLKRKYGGSLQAVAARIESIDQEISGIESLSEQVEKCEKRIVELHQKLCATAPGLSAKRQKAAKVLAEKVVRELTSLKMVGTEFKVSFETVPASKDAEVYLTVDGKAVFETGIDRVSLQIAPNVGEDPKPLASIASGGELSRVVLALKAILAKSESVETVIFDEVDAGIGGGVAEVVGQKLATLAKYHQVVCITHLPQIAKFGKHHFRISKQVEGGRTRTHITPLEEDERVKEIARMLGGVTITQATLDHAREMLESR